MTKEVWKGLAMALVGVVITFITITPVQWAMMVITLLGTALVYLGKNAIPTLQSISKAWRLDVKNIISALLILVGTGILEAIGMIVIEGQIIWVTLLKVVGGITLTYLGGTLYTSPNTKQLKKAA